jgi:hypothetical protein
MTGDDSAFLVVTSSISCQFQNFGSSIGRELIPNKPRCIEKKTITVFVIIVTRRMPPVEQELIILPEFIPV